MTLLLVEGCVRLQGNAAYPPLSKLKQARVDDPASPSSQPGAGIGRRFGSESHVTCNLIPSGLESLDKPHRVMLVRGRACISMVFPGEGRVRLKSIFLSITIIET